jgi:hypothetical protein
VRVLRSPSPVVSGSVYRGPSSFTHNIKAKDPLSHFDQVVDFGEHDNSEIKRAVLPHTELKYERALRILHDQLVPICVNSTLIMIDIHSSVFLADFSSYILRRLTHPISSRARHSWSNTLGRLDERPTGMSKYRVTAK